MELVSLAKDMLQDVAEHVASYRVGQTTLRYLDRALWTLEKCARWAVPPPLDQDERPQPELVRPLPWLFFLALLVALRITRESISLFNLVLGKPPLRSADVVTYIQGKRRYLRTLKYQGNRMMRARNESAPRQSWLSSMQSLLEFTMCFRRQPRHYGNNNTTHLSNNDEVLVVKRSKRGGHEATAAPAANETTMERLIEKIMIDLDAESDEDASFTLTNVTSIRSDQSEYNTEPEHDTAVHVDTSTPNTSASAELTADAISVSAVSQDSTADGTVEVNINMSSDGAEHSSNSFENENAIKTEDPSKVHNKENGTMKGKKKKIGDYSFPANGRAITSSPSKKRMSSEDDGN